MRALIGICQRRLVEEFQVELRVVGDSKVMPLVQVDPGLVLPDRDHNPFFSIEATDIAFADFIPAWLAVARTSPVPLAAATPHATRQTLESRVVEAVSAAETLHRSLHADERDQAFVDRITQALKATGSFNGAERRRIVRAVEVTEVTLERRLRELGADLGREFCMWFFGGQLDSWAFVAATIRNALSHGYPTRHRLERDPGALAGVLETTTALIQLRLLCEAGLRTDQNLVQLLVSRRAYFDLLHQSVADRLQLARTIRNP
ncbi:MAG: HEPN domain-containing protein [Mycobacteriales bacterium]